MVNREGTEVAKQTASSHLSIVFQTHGDAQVPFGECIKGEKKGHSVPKHRKLPYKLYSIIIEPDCLVTTINIR